MKEYCTQNDGDCSTCSLVNYGLDCANNALPQVTRLQTKYERVKALSPIGKYHRTFDAIWSGIPDELKDQLTSKQLTLVVAAKAQSFQDGKASTGAEMVDDNAVWINSLNRAIEWTEEGTEYEDHTEVIDKPGCMQETTRQRIKTKDGVLVARFAD